MAIVEEPRLVRHEAPNPTPCYDYFSMDMVYKMLPPALLPPTVESKEKAQRTRLVMGLEAKPKPRMVTVALKVGK